MSDRAEGGLSRGRPPSLDSLKRFVATRPVQRPGEACEMCGEAILADHPHVVNVDTRQLLCTCRGCYLLFTNPGAAGGKYRAVPRRYQSLPAFALAATDWDQLQIPVAVAFFFFNSSLGRFVAFYPSPAGATESLLPLETWDEIQQRNPVLASLQPDVEALLVYRRPGGNECYLVPIDACYELVGRIRLDWKGFDGGDKVWQEIERFFTLLRQKSDGEAVRGSDE